MVTGDGKELVYAPIGSLPLHRPQRPLDRVRLLRLVLRGQEGEGLLVQLHAVRALSGVLSAAIGGTAAMSKIETKVYIELET